MSTRTTRFARALLGVLAALATACSGNAVTQPSSTTPGTTSGGVSGALSTSSVAAPRPVQPANGANILNSSQPVTLVVQNAVITRSAAATYTFEVATDSGFATKAQTKDGLAEGAGGQTSVKLDTL